MTAPTAFFVDLNSTITPRTGIAVDPTTGAATILTVDGSGTQVASPVGGGGGGGGVPVALATGHMFANADNGATVIAVGTPNYVLNIGLMPGWGVSIKGAFTFTGTAAAGVTDDRSPTGIAWCCMEQTDTAGTGLTYDLVGTK